MSSSKSRGLIEIQSIDFCMRSFGSCGQSPEPLPLERPLITLSNFKPDKENVRALSDGSIALHLAPGEVSLLSY